MITKITIHKVASYKAVVALETDKKINLIYGLNGSGKTIISNYLQNPESNEFHACRIEGLNQEGQKILVYNQKFIDENFYTRKLQKGIFTLGKESKEAIEKIDKAKDERENLWKKLDDPSNGLDTQLKKKKAEKEANYDTASKETWNIKTEYTGGDRIFDKAGFLFKLKTQKNLFEHIIAIPLQETDREIEEIKKELQELGEGGTERDEISLLEINQISEIEQDNILQEEIIGSQNSTVANLILQLGNVDWVKQGLEYFPQESSRTCPFCQQDTLTPKLQAEIKNYFDQTYQEKTEKIQSIKNSYGSTKDSFFLEHVKKDFFDENEKDKITSLFDELVNILQNNLRKIDDKIRNPSQPVTLEQTDKKILEINKFIADRNQDIDRFNSKVKNYDQTIKDLKTEFWQILRKRYDPTISSYKDSFKKLEKEQQQIECNRNKIKLSIGQQDQIISEQQQNTTNITETIKTINQQLYDIGMQDITIVKNDVNTYRIQRSNDNQENVFKTLSEGEKTMISFLYFVELCKGLESSDDAKKKIIVIDDPISSLSHIYVFNVAQIIKQLFFKPLIAPPNSDYLQCFILTHNLYFFHEICRNKEHKKHKKHKELFRVSKNQNGSSILVKMESEEIKNDYESYWSVVRNANGHHKATVANSMRNIIENFCAFLYKEDHYTKIFDGPKFQDSKFQAFIRYMNRESHSDRENISDFKEFDLSVFLEAFAEFFRLLDHEKHYQKHMKSEKE